MSNSPCCAPSCCGPESPAPRLDDSADGIREQVRSQYAGVATREGSGREKGVSLALGYSEAELGNAPEDANLGVGCGNPTALASLSPGETVLDLGAGAGLDAFIAAEKVGPGGQVIGVDMTPEMLARARANAVKAGVADRVEFRAGVIEDLPVVSDSVDVVISNCVINLSPDKPQVFREAYRVLKPGGRLAVSDIALTEALPKLVAQHAALYAACVGGAMVIDDYIAAIEQAGFKDVRVTSRDASAMIENWIDDPIVSEVVASVGKEEVLRIAKTVRSYAVEALKA